MNTSTCHPRLPDRQNDDIFLSNNMEKISRKERLRKSSGEKVVGYEMTGKHELARSWGLELRRLFIQGLEVFFVEMPVREYFGGPVPEHYTKAKKEHYTHASITHMQKETPCNEFRQFQQFLQLGQFCRNCGIYQIIAGCHRMLSCER